MGYTADRDADTWSFGAIYSAANGDLWTATARVSWLDRYIHGDPNNTVAHFPTDYDALEFGWKGHLFGEQISADLGVESIDPVNADRDIHLYGFVGWRHQFQP
jgi:hypothetical protein